MDHPFFMVCLFMKHMHEKSVVQYSSVNGMISYLYLKKMNFFGKIVAHSFYFIYYLVYSVSQTPTFKTSS